MSNNKIKVVGYAQRIFYNDGIEYRNFSPDLVGNQLASAGGTPLMTMGNFSITTNMDPKSDKTFITNKFSNFITLSDLDLTLEETNTLLSDNAGVILNLDKTKLGYYSLFGSLSEYIRVSLEDIITKWPASLYTVPVSQTSTGQILNGNTFDAYTYDPITQISTFKVDTTFINNKFQINYLLNGSIADTFNASNDLRNLTVNYASYVILNNEIEYPVIGFTGSTSLTYDYIYFKVQGNPFSGTSGRFSYHIKPSKLNEEKFFNALPDFEAFLLNRQVTPQYTATFNYPVKSDTGIILYVTESLTWPVSDGYNIDFDTTDYINYASKLLEISSDNDLFSSDLMYRFLVSESISNFDTTPVHLSDLDQDTSGQKMTKTLRIYGREYDEINRFITGIEFANTVTYNKQDNTPDVYLKNLARVLGWNLISSVVENDLLANYVTTAPSSYSGMSVGYTAAEADVELWRRLILNTPWLWKSKGARKSIEFLLKFIGAPQGLVKFNEYIYKAEAPIDIELFQQVLTLNGLDTDLSIYPIDSDGYPSPLPDTPDMYFQNNGLWYRETGGSGSTIDILTGNNPHLGPYDGGFKYINQFRNLIPNFSAVTLTSQTTTTGSVNLFTNYNLGQITNYTGPTYVDALNQDGFDLGDCVVVTSTIIPDPMPSDYITNCGCASADDDDSLSICVDKSSTVSTIANNAVCNDLISATSDPNSGVFMFSFNQYNIDGSLYSVPLQTYYASQTCCSLQGGIPYLFNQVKNVTTAQAMPAATAEVAVPTSGTTGDVPIRTEVGPVKASTTEVGTTTTVLVNSGYICCDPKLARCGCSISCAQKWVANTTPINLPPHTSTYNGPSNPFLSFTRNDGSTAIVTPDGCNCVREYTIAVPNVTDPNTGEKGYGCQLTQLGIADLANGTSSNIYQFYLSKSTGKVDCYEQNMIMK